MTKIILKWVFICLGIGFIPVLMLGASQGGIALSPYIIIFSLVVGLFGAAIHATIYAFKSGNKKNKIWALVFLSISFLFVSWIYFTSNKCNLTKEYAIKRMSKLISRKENLDIQFLKKPVFNVEKCSFIFSYESEKQNLDFIITSYGDIHTWNYNEQSQE